jgi:hypothetical protein
MAKSKSATTAVVVSMGVLLTIGAMLVAAPSAYAEKTCIGVCKNHHNEIDNSQDSHDTTNIDSHDTIDNSQDNDVTTNNDNDVTTNNDNDVCTGGLGGPGSPGGGTGGAGGACNL